MGVHGQLPCTVGLQTQASIGNPASSSRQALERQRDCPQPSALSQTIHHVTTIHHITNASTGHVRGVHAIICHTREAAKLQPNRKSFPKNDAQVPPGSGDKLPTGSRKQIPPAPTCALWAHEMSP